ncbi:MAG: hypothetical protein U0263_40160 [Polyangiaceae bacterium]
MPGCPIDFAFEVFAKRDLGDLPEVTGAPEWLVVSMHHRAEEPDLFELAPELEQELDRAARASLRAAPFLYRVCLSPDSRPDEDAHLQFAIPIAAGLAEATDGVVLDRAARRVLDPESFRQTCAPETECHLSYALGSGAVETRGLTKFGFLELRLPLPGVAPADNGVAFAVIDAMCGALLAGAFVPGRQFELCGGRWRIEECGDHLEVIAGDVPIAQVLADLSEEYGELSVEPEPGDA